MTVPDKSAAVREGITLARSHIVSTPSVAGNDAPGSGTSFDVVKPPIRTALLSPCKRFRFTLGRHWDRQRPRGVVVMVNPSSADAQTDDPTIRRLMHWYRAWGFGGFTVVNLLPCRTPDPREALEWYRQACVGSKVDQQALQDNFKAIADVTSQAEHALVAWGCIAADLQPLAQLVLDDLREHTGDTLLCLGRTAGGFPIHPMARGKHRVPDSVTPTPFRSYRNE